MWSLKKEVEDCLGAAQLGRFEQRKQSIPCLGKNVLRDGLHQGVGVAEVVKNEAPADSQQLRDPLNRCAVEAVPANAFGKGLDDLGPSVLRDTGTADFSPRSLPSLPRS